MWKCDEYIGSKIVNKIVHLRQRNSNQLSANFLEYISRAREAKLEHLQVQKNLECVNILNFPLPPPHLWNSYCHFQIALELGKQWCSLAHILGHPKLWVLWSQSCSRCCYWESRGAGE